MPPAQTTAGLASVRQVPVVMESARAMLRVVASATVGLHDPDQPWLSG
ncbi:MAG: hypothetical protein ABI836_02660 [Gemmatimonadota bacterium]